MQEVSDVLKTAGFSHVKSITQLEGQMFCKDLHCLDLLVFPTCAKRELHKTNLLKDCRLVIQVHTHLHYKHTTLGNVLIFVCAIGIYLVSVISPIPCPFTCTSTQTVLTKVFVIMVQWSKLALQLCEHWALRCTHFLPSLLTYKFINELWNVWKLGEAKSLILLWISDGQRVNEPFLVAFFSVNQVNWFINMRWDNVILTVCAWVKLIAKYFNFV